MLEKLDEVGLQMFAHRETVRRTREREEFTKDNATEIEEEP